MLRRLHRFCGALVAVAATAVLPQPAHAARVSIVASGLEIPWEIAFLPNGDALVTERPGRVRLLTAAGHLRRSPVAFVPVSAIGEGGLLGLAVEKSGKVERRVHALAQLRAAQVVECPF